MIFTRTRVSLALPSGVTVYSLEELVTVLDNITKMQVWFAH